MSKQYNDDDYRITPEDIAEALRVFMRHYGLTTEAKEKRKKFESKVIYLDDYRKNDARST